MKAFDTFVDRVLGATDDSEHARHAQLVNAFRIFLLAHVATRLYFWAVPWANDYPRVKIGLAVAGVVALIAGFFPRLARAGTLLAATALWIKLFLSFPWASNHSAIEIVFMTLLALFDLRSEEGRSLFLQAGRWIIVIILFCTGLQKLMYGTYFDGQFLGIQIAMDSKFTRLFEDLLPAVELERLLSMTPDNVGSGPYAVRSTFFVLVSNLVWVFELVAPVFLLMKRTRAVAVLAVILFTVALQAGAREFMFGLLYVNLVMLFTTRGWIRSLLPVSLGSYAFLIIMYHFYPEWKFN